MKTEAKTILPEIQGFHFSLDFSIIISFTRVY